MLRRLGWIGAGSSRRADLEEAELHAADSIWNPPFHSDARQAWTGLRRSCASRPHRIGDDRSSSGSLVRGRNPRRPQRGSPNEGRARGAGLSASILFVSVLLGGLAAGAAKPPARAQRPQRCVSACEHLRCGAHAGVGVLGHPPRDVTRRRSTSFNGSLASTLYEGVMLWMLYLALEPYVRKRWPETIISWTRVLAGRFRDPLVGRDILLGCLLGVAMRALADAPRWLGVRPAPPRQLSHCRASPARGTSSASSWTVRSTRCWRRCFFLVLLLPLRRRAASDDRWPPGRSWSLAGLIGWAFGQHWLDPVGNLLLAGAVLLSLTRFGLLATTVLFATENALDVLHHGEPVRVVRVRDDPGRALGLGDRRLRFLHRVRRPPAVRRVVASGMNIVKSMDKNGLAKFETALKRRPSRRFLIIVGPALAFRCRHLQESARAARTSRARGLSRSVPPTAASVESRAREPEPTPSASGSGPRLPDRYRKHRHSNSAGR